MGVISPSMSLREFEGFRDQMGISYSLASTFLSAGQDLKENKLEPAWEGPSWSC
jgi:hypothetical protein